MLSRGAERLLDLLRWYGSRFRRIIPLQKSLGKELDVTERQVQRWVRELKALGLLRVKKYGRAAAEYHLLPESR